MTQQHKTCIAENRAVSYNTANWHIAYCMQDAHNTLLYCNTDVIIIKPVTGRARICPASLKTTRRVNCLRFSCNILPYTIYWYVEVSALHYIILQYCYILIYCDSSSWKCDTVVASTTCNRKGIHVLWYSSLWCSWTSSMRMW